MAMRRPRIKVTANLINSKRKDTGPKAAARLTAGGEKPKQAAGKAADEKATAKIAEQQADVNALSETSQEASNDARPADEVSDASNEGSGVVDGEKASEGKESIKTKLLRQTSVPKHVLEETQTSENQPVAVEGEIEKIESGASLVLTQPAEATLAVTQPADAPLSVTQPAEAETSNTPAEVENAHAVAAITPMSDAAPLKPKIAKNGLKTPSAPLPSFASPDPAFQLKKLKREPKLEVPHPTEATNDAVANFEIDATSPSTAGGALPSFEIFLNDSTSYASIIELSLNDNPKPPAQPTAPADFKCPPSVAVAYASNEHDVSESAIEDDIIKKDLQQSAQNLPTANTKSRQRIRATPIFGQRRSNMQSTATGDEATTTTETNPPTRQRERHYSGSQYHPYANAVASPQYSSPHKAIPHSVGRIRTESNCSVYSDVSVTKSSRKGDDHNQRPTSRRDYEARFGQGVPDKSKLKMFDLLYYNPNTNPIIENADEAALLKKKRREKDEFLSSTGSADVKSLRSSPDITEERKSHAELPVPQLKLNANGELILDDSTLEIENSAEQKARVALANSKLIHLDATTGMNGFYKRQKRTKEWSSDETVRFYRALQRLGTDFSLMEQLFPNRTRRDLKLKFKKEERCNLSLINKAILSPRAFELDELKQQLEEEDKAKAEAEEKWMEIQTTEGKPLKKIRTKSAAARALCHGDDVYEMENVPKSNISKRGIKKIKEKKEKDSAHPESVQPKRKYVKRKQAEPAKEKIKKIKSERTEAEVEHVILMDDQLEYEISELLDIAAAEDSENEEREEAKVQKAKVETAVLDTEDYAEADDWTAGRDYESVSSAGSPEAIENADECQVDHSNLECVEGLNEQRKEHLQKLFEDLCAGCLAVVTTEDPNEPGQLTNDIYMLNKATGQLCERPLELPDDIRDSILAVWEECS